MVQASPIRLIEPYPFTYRLTIRPIDANETLLTVLTRKFPYVSQQIWTERIESGQVKLDGGYASDSTYLRLNQEISIYHERVIEPTVPDTTRVHHVTDDYILVEKPAPMPVHSGGRYHRNTLLNILADMGYDDLKIVHRLDAVTSGLILFARTSSFAKAVGHAYTEGAVKQYYALVEPAPINDEFTIDAAIFRKKGFVFDTGSHPEARDARTHFKVVKRFDGGALVACQPETGRTHQIRLHLRDAGCPIAGDVIYQRNGNGRLQNRAIALFSSSLHLPSMDLDFSIAYPNEWASADALSSFA